MTRKILPYRLIKMVYKGCSLFISLVIILGSILSSFNVARAAASLSIEIIAAPNLVVDSNVLSPSSYQPIVATVIGKFCNEGIPGVDGNITNLVGYIGDYVDGTNDTPGDYPDRTPGGVFSGTYEFTHLGGTSDAARLIGTLEPGQCSYQYWSFTYPKTATASDGVTTIPAWGTSVKPDDDLWLQFDIWGTGYNEDTPGSETQTATHTMTMRNEISAMANKIEPNGNPGGQWFNTDTSTVYPGETITTNGILYRLGNVNQGFDNDGDGVPDYNAWLQPFGDPAYDPSCFRLVSTTGVLTVTRSSGPDLIIPFDNSLYFTDLPPDNTNVVGEVFYEFLALGGVCTIPITPYQEVASGADNEKFNGDYGTGIDPLESYEPEVTVNKNGDATIGEGATISYSIPFSNPGSVSAGLTLAAGGVNAPLMISDTVPISLTYVGGSAVITNTSTITATIYFSTDGGQSWTTTDPGDTLSTAANPVVIQWWLGQPLDPGESASAFFQASLSGTYISDGGDPFIENCAEGSFGDAASFEETCTFTMVDGDNTIGDYVFADADGDGIWDEDGTGGTTPSAGDEPGINGVTVWLYWDKDGDGDLDITVDELISTTTTAISGTHAGMYSFGNLPNGDFIVKVDATDSDLQTSYPGYTPTTTEYYAVTLSDSNYWDADFGFGPSLLIDKHLESLDPAYVGEDVVFHIDLNNLRPGDGTPNGFCTYELWTTVVIVDTSDDPPGGNNANSQWVNPTNVIGIPDGSYAETGMRDTADRIGLSGYNTAGKTGNITSVHLKFHYTEVAEMQFDDEIGVYVWRNNVDPGTPFVTFYGDEDFTDPVGSDYISETVAIGGSWAWSDFTNNLSEIQLITGSQPDSGDIGLDAAAFVITTDELCAGANSTIATLPLTDTYDADLLQFVSADPPVSSSTTSGSSPNTVGTLTWDNLGPLYAGGTRTVEVTFEALTTTSVTTNTAEVTNAYFANGYAANDDEDDATVGIVASGAITGTVWADTNGNEWQGTSGWDSGDSGIPGVTLELYGCFSTLTGLLIPVDNSNSPCANNDGEWNLITTTTTDGNGDYVFDSLRDGYYDVRVTESTLPAGFTTRQAEADPTDGTAGFGCTGNTCDGQWVTDSNGSEEAVRDLDFLDNSTGGETNTDVSFGYRDDSGDGAVVGYVWHDQDGDGSGVNVEPPIANITVTLDDGSCSPTCPTTTTDSNGFYSFGNVAPGTYTVTVTAPSGMTQTGDPDATLDNRTTTPITVVAHSVSGPYNFGYTGGYDIGNTIYTDWNGDGDQDSGEEGLSGVTVYLYNDVDGDGVLNTITDTLHSITTTVANGQYYFRNLPGNGNDYIVAVIESSLPSGYSQTGDPNESGTCSTCDGLDPVTLNTEDYLDADFGYQPQGYGSIGDYVWFDSDADGVQDSNESGISGVSISLYHDEDGDGVIDAEDAVVMTTTTDASGIYTFTNLISEEYIVRIDPSNFNAGQPLDGYLLTSTGTPYNTNQVSYEVTLQDAQDFEDADFGFANSAIGDFIWQDNDGDGEYDDGEPGISGVTVRLYEWNDDGDGVVEGGEWGSLLASDVTDSDGLYEFTGLISATYIVSVETSSLVNYSLTYDPDAYENNNDPYPPFDPAGTYIGLDSVHGVSLYTGQTYRLADFAYQPEGVIGDSVWIDSDGDGVRDPDEQGISNVTMYLCSVTPCDSTTLPANVYMTTTTNADGVYSFGSLTDDTTYYVGVGRDDPDFPGGLSQTYDPDSSCPGAGCDDESSQLVDTDDASGGVYLDVDFGYRFSGSNTITGTVWHDNDSGGNNNGSGDIDGGETIRYEDVPIYLWYCGDVDATCGDGDDILVGVTTTLSTTGVYTFTGLADGTYRVVANEDAYSLRGTDPTGYTDFSGGDGTNDEAVEASGGGTYTRDFGFISVVDMGDLPSAYNITTFVDNGARHEIPAAGAVYLGSAAPDVDADATESANAVGDDNTGDDEDGVIRTTDVAWQDGADGGSVDVTVTCVGTCYLSAWIDWNGDNDFNDANEQILLDQAVTSGSQTITFDVAAGTFSNNPSDPNVYVNARFRLYRDTTNGLAQTTGLVENGEVEDYRWGFLPTAVKLQSFSSRNYGFVGITWVALASIALLSVPAVFILRKRKR